jgi:hypothetical protein
MAFRKDTSRTPSYTIQEQAQNTVNENNLYQNINNNQQSKSESAILSLIISSFANWMGIPEYFAIFLLCVFSLLLLFFLRYFLKMARINYIREQKNKHQ